MLKDHHYWVQVDWTGNTGQGTVSYQAYERTHRILAEGKSPILGSADPAFRGDKALYNPEELLVGSLSTCHMLWYLHLCAEASVVVVSYTDSASGLMRENQEMGGSFVEVVLKPVVTVTKDSDVGNAEKLHEHAHQLCFIANSVRFPVHCQPVIIAQKD